MVAKSSPLRSLTMRRRKAATSSNGRNPANPAAPPARSIIATRSSPARAISALPRRVCQVGVTPSEK